MAGKSKEKEKIYNYFQIIKCAKCGFVAENPGPCLECKNETFVPLYKLQEIGKK